MLAQFRASHRLVGSSVPQGDISSFFFFLGGGWGAGGLGMVSWGLNVLAVLRNSSSPGLFLCFHKWYLLIPQYPYFDDINFIKLSRSKSLGKKLTILLE